MAQFLWDLAPQGTLAAWSLVVPSFYHSGGESQPFASLSEAQPLRFSSPPLIPSPTPIPFQGIRDLFYLRSLKKLVAKVTGAGEQQGACHGGGALPPNSCQWEQSQKGLESLPLWEEIPPGGHIPLDYTVPPPNFHPPSLPIQRLH